MIGSDGFGFVLVDGRHQKSPQVGTVEIGDDVVIASGVSILDHDHRTHVVDGHLVVENGEFTTAPVRIGNNVWLGDKVTVVKGVTIGDDVLLARRVDVDGAWFAAQGGRGSATTASSSAPSPPADARPAPARRSRSRISR